MRVYQVALLLLLTACQQAQPYPPSYKTNFLQNFVHYKGKYADKPKESFVSMNEGR